MAASSLDQNLQSQNSMLLLIEDDLDCLYCEELCLEDEDSELGYNRKQESETNFNQDSKKRVDIYIDDDDNDNDGEELVALLCKEEETTQVKESVHIGHDVEEMLWMAARREAVEWMKRVSAHYGFLNATLVLGVSNFDRFGFSGGFHTDKPWMIQLVSVACLSLAAKIEETHVPLLLDFQIDSKYVFEAKTIQRMELLVLSSVGWRMSPVTPFSYFEHLMKGLGLNAELHWGILSRFEEIVLSLITDLRFLSYSPSLIAAATMVHMMKDQGHCGSLENKVCHMFAGKIRQDKVEDCCMFIREVSSKSQDNKRRRDDTLTFCPTKTIKIKYAAQS
ncbi:Cyclin-D3-1-like protein [Drosera capensis]